MRLTRILGVTCLALVGILTANASQAGAFFLGASIGRAGESFEVRGEDVTLEGSATAWKAYWGFGILKHLAIEGGYIDLGAPDLSSGAYDLQPDVWGVNFAAVFRADAGPVEFFGKVMSFSWKATYLKYDGLYLAPEDSAIDIGYGGGLALNLGKTAIRAEVEYFDSPEIGTPLLASVGIALRF